MSIPIQNIYFLLCYAWDMLDTAGIVDVSQEDRQSVAELFGRILESGTTHLLKRGLDRSYVIEEIDGPSVRGKLDLTTTVKRNLLRHMQVHCVVDSLQHDVLHNQIVRTTLGRMVRCQNLDRELRDRLLRLYRRLSEISEVPLSPKAFGDVILHRNNAYYRFLLQLCRLIYENRLIDERPGGWQFRDFLREPKAMARLFERFVFTFLRREQTQFSVRREQFAWQDVAGNPEALAVLPVMNTDISLESADRKIVVDTKYYQATLQESQFGKSSVHSANLYQLYAYLANIMRLEGGRRPIEGVLLYPTVSQSLDLEYRIHGHRVRILTVDLNRPWNEIHDRLLVLIA